MTFQIANIAVNELLGQRVHASCSVVGISVNSAGLSDAAASEYLRGIEREYNLPATDSYRYGADILVDALLERVI